VILTFNLPPSENWKPRILQIRTDRINAMTGPYQITGNRTLLCTIHMQDGAIFEVLDDSQADENRASWETLVGEDA
jgi:hypothetical protein